MSAKTTRKSREEAIVHEWCIELDATSNEDTFKGDMNAKRFKNPVAYHIDQTAHDVVGFLFSDEDDPDMPASLEDMCRLMALQDASPSSVFASFFKLRSIIFSKIGKSDTDMEAVMLVDGRIDACVLKAMDYYSVCREQIMQFRIDELKRRDKMYEGLRSSRVEAREG